MSDFYRELKPYMNKLSELNVWDSLFVIRQYCLKSFPNYKIETPNFSNIEHPFRCNIPVYFADFLISASLKFSSTCKSQKSLRQFSTRLQLLKKFDDVYNRANQEQYEDILIWLKTYLLNQFKMQHFQLFSDRLYKYYYLYSAPKISEHVKRVIGVTIEQYITIIALLYFEFSRNFGYEFDKLVGHLVYDGKRFSKSDFIFVVENLIATIQDVKKNIRIDYSNKLFLCHNNATHVVTPIFRDNDMVYCPFPTYILNSGIDGLQYRLNLKNSENKGLNDEVALRFEDYIGQQLEYYANAGKTFQYIREQVYNKGQNKTSDWIVYDNECLLFIDCKLKKLTIDAILETKLDRVKFDSTIDSIKFGNRKSVEQLISMQDSPLVKDILEIGIDLGKILCCCEDWKNGKIPSLPPFTKNYQIKAIVLTLEETFCGHFIIKEMVDKVAFKYVLDKKKSFPQNVKTSIISSSTFDNSIPLISKYGIYNHVFEDNFEYKEGKNESNEFLSMKFDEFFE